MQLPASRCAGSVVQAVHVSGYETKTDSGGKEVLLPVEDGQLLLERVPTHVDYLWKEAGVFVRASMTSNFYP